jgi:hypothetical protein
MADLTVSSDIDTFMGSANNSAARSNLGLAIGSDVQAYSALLAAVAGLTPTDGVIIVGNGTTFVAESGATARTSLGLGTIATLAAPSGDVVGTSDTQTLTNKTIAFGSNTLSGLPCEVGIAVSDESTALTTGTAKVTFRMPYAMTLTDVRASVATAPVGSTIEVDINEGGVSVLSAVLSIDASEKTSETAATPAVISDSALADDAEITIDIDQVGSSTAGAGLKIWLIGTRA